MMAMTVMTVLAHLMELPGIVIVDAYQQATQVMTVMTVLVSPMVITCKIIVIHVMLIAPMTVYRIVPVNGVVQQK
jgi:hypothetical protein